MSGLYCRVANISWFFFIHLTFMRTPSKKSRSSVYPTFLLYIVKNAYCIHMYIFFGFLLSESEKRGGNKELFLNREKMLLLMLQSSLYHKKLFLNSKSVAYKRERPMMVCVGYIKLTPWDISVFALVLILYLIRIFLAFWAYLLEPPFETT